MTDTTEQKIEEKMGEEEATERQDKEETNETQEKEETTETQVEEETTEKQVEEETTERQKKEETTETQEEEETTERQKKEETTETQEEEETTETQEEEETTETQVEEETTEIQENEETKERQEEEETTEAQEEEETIDIQEKERSIVKLAKNRQETEYILDLLKNGADPDEKDHQGMTAMHWAARTANEPLLLGLLAAKADPHLSDMHDNTPLLYAVLKHSSPCVKILLEAGADPNYARRHVGITSLHIAARHSYAEIVKLLLAHGADPNVRNAQGETALHATVDNGSLDVVIALIDAGADAKIQLTNGDTALHLLATAITRNRNPGYMEARVDTMQELMKSYNASFIVNQQGETPLDVVGHDFIRSQSIDLCLVVKTLLEMKLKQRSETATNILYGVCNRYKYYPNTLPLMLPYLTPKQLVVKTVRPLEIHFEGCTTHLSFHPTSARNVQSSRKRMTLTPAEQFIRVTRMLCEVGCSPPKLKNIEALIEEDDDNATGTPFSLSACDRDHIREALTVWEDYSTTGPSLQTLARNAVRRGMLNLKQESFYQLPIPPRMRTYVAMTDLKNLE